jgi:large subunit ribosomal protein L21
MYAIIRTGGKQFRAEPGQTIRVPSMTAEVGETVTFDDVLVTHTDDGVMVGTPAVEGARVKWKRRKNYRRKQGHRQKYTAVRIDEIKAG